MIRGYGTQSSLHNKHIELILAEGDGDEEKEVKDDQRDRHGCDHGGTLRSRCTSQRGSYSNRSQELVRRRIASLG